MVVLEEMEEGIYYHMSDSGHAFSCLSTSGADQGIVPYMLEVFDVQSKCSCNNKTHKLVKVVTLQAH